MPNQLAPLAQRIAIARDPAFAFIYPHMLSDWQAKGAELSFFSPLQDEAPAHNADAVFFAGRLPRIARRKAIEREQFCIWHAIRCRCGQIDLWGMRRLYGAGAKPHEQAGRNQQNAWTAAA